jgi:hypothetical protein
MRQQARHLRGIDPAAQRHTAERALLPPKSIALAQQGIVEITPG